MAGNTDPSQETLERLINLGHLSSGVGHHVINAFSAIVSNAELLRIEGRNPAFADPVALADTIIKTALDASTVARRLIDYTRPVTSIEPEGAAFDADTVNLKDLCGEFVAGEVAKQHSGVVWESELTDLPPIRGHVVQLRAMLGHLTRNAYEALPAAGGTIRLATASDARGWNVVEIRDTGGGMDARTLERAVEPFFSTKHGQLGVGLSIANGIWRRHRGTLSIQSQRDEGTRVRLCVEPTPLSALPKRTV